MRRAFLPCLLFPGAALAIFASADVESVPVARLIENVERQLAASPKDPALTLNLARLHAMAYATKGEAATVEKGTLRPEEGGALPRIPWRVRPGTDEKARGHLKRAIRAYRDLLQKEPRNEPGRLGLGWCLLEAGEKAEAAQVLRKLAAEAWETDSKAKAGGFAPFLAEEAMEYLVAALDAKKDAAEIAELRRRLVTLGEKPRPMTPIAVPLVAGAELDDILAARAAVRFDVDGRERPGSWSWITPAAGWLVWLPRDGTRAVRSGLQLVGGVTFWLFWRDGYQALAALDDDGDGWLRGGELEGLGVWRDGDGDGRSGAGEVRTLAELGIEALAVASRPGRRPEVLRWSPRGAILRGGEARPTWDVLLRYRPPPRPGATRASSNEAGLHHTSAACDHLRKGGPPWRD